MEDKSGEILKQLAAIRTTLEQINNGVKIINETPPQKSSDELFREAKDLTISTGYASPALFQRKLRIGYARAARLVDMLEEDGIIGPRDGAKPRKVLKTT
jgi:S-DNA-T family DNA segregation ATPase FtsK/SpoIIIE